jgi:hypothetical protein
VISCRLPGLFQLAWLLWTVLRWTSVYRCLYCILTYVPLGRCPRAHHWII